ncbi:MAG: DUF512 domain-containing protein [candidate division NC10 bacterium]|nr:DUF512 domain-containing protein [candidate division NC10 bacterium]
MEKERGLLVRFVPARGPGRELGIKAGSRILSINGVPLRDEIDYRFLMAAAEVRIRFFNEWEGEREVRVRRALDQGWGLEFEPFPVRSCNNHCLFCFVDQLPKGLRPSLYFKDEDYRLSFLHGNYVTLTNLTEGDWNRVAKQRLSPLFISVHSTDPGIRRFLLGNPKAPDIMSQLRRLAQARIRMHLQVVICPGLNDGPSLERTIQDLASLRPHACSLSLVPVGLTAHRQGLFSLSPLGPEKAAEILELSERYRRQFRAGDGHSFLHLADEIYLLAKRPFPSPRTYDGYPQLENGVGLSQRFLAGFHRREKSLPSSLREGRSFLLLTGRMAFPLLLPIVDRLNQIRNLRIELAALTNSLFGPSVTVAGLLSGRDLRDALKGNEDAQLVLIPESALRDGGDVFLDDLSLVQLSEEVGKKIVPVRDAASLLRLLFVPQGKVR